MIGAIVIRTAMLSRVDGVPGASGAGEHRRRYARRFGWCIGTYLTHFAERFMEQPGKGLGSLERLRRGLSGSRDVLEAPLGLAGHPTWMRRQIKTRATGRSWYHNRFGAMRTSPLTMVKGDHCTVFTHSRIIR